MEGTTQKQIEANRENGKLGGVKTEGGKEISKLNAIKHGLLSQKAIFRWEDGELLHILEEAITSEYKPEGEIEKILIDRICSGFWRLQRILSLESNNAFERNVFERKLELTGTADRFIRYEMMIERSIYKALHELERIQAKRNGENVPLPVALDVDISGGKENGFVS